ncbi:hypothetical protein N0V86_007260, partial [Didymella sp. IMI 355093]
MSETADAAPVTQPTPLIPPTTASSTGPAILTAASMGIQEEDDAGSIASHIAVIRKINPTMLYTHLQDLVKTPHQSELDNYAIAIEQFRSSWFLSPAAPFLHKGIQMDVTIERTCLVVHMFDSKADGLHRSTRVGRDKSSTLKADH